MSHPSIYMASAHNAKAKGQSDFWLTALAVLLFIGVLITLQAPLKNVLTAPLIPFGAAAVAYGLCLLAAKAHRPLWQVCCGIDGSSMTFILRLIKFVIGSNASESIQSRNQNLPAVTHTNLVMCGHFTCLIISNSKGVFGKARIFADHSRGFLSGCSQINTSVFSGSDTVNLSIIKKTV